MRNFRGILLCKMCIRDRGSLVSGGTVMMIVSLTLGGLIGEIININALGVFSLVSITIMLISGFVMYIWFSTLSLFLLQPLLSLNKQKRIIVHNTLSISSLITFLMIITLENKFCYVPTCYKSELSFSSCSVIGNMFSLK